MIKRHNEYRTELREEMRGGKGTVRIEHFWEPKTEMRSRNRMFAKLTIEPNGSIGFHPHDAEEEVFVVLRGKAEADDNGEVVELNAGDTILTGNGDGHAIRNIGEEPLELLAVISTYHD